MSQCDAMMLCVACRILARFGFARKQARVTSSTGSRNGAALHWHGFLTFSQYLLRLVRYDTSRSILYCEDRRLKLATGLRTSLH
jgi:hypothetical protein